MSIDDLKNAELQEKLKAAKSPEELLALAKVIELDSGGDLYFALHLSYILLGAFIHLTYLLSVRDIAEEGGALKIAMHALSWLAFSELYYACCAAAAFMVRAGNTGSEIAQTLGNVIVIMKYVKREKD